jgi:hypothetical protein
MLIVRAATLQPAGVLRTVWRTEADPSIGEDEAGVRSSNVLATVGCGPLSSMTAFSVKCSVPGGSAAQTREIVSLSSWALA